MGGRCSFRDWPIYRNLDYLAARSVYPLLFRHWRSFAGYFIGGDGIDLFYLLGGYGLDLPLDSQERWRPYLSPEHARLWRSKWLGALSRRGIA